MKKHLLLSAFVVFFSVIGNSQIKDTIIKKPVAIPKNYVAQLDIVYTKVKDWEGKADLYLALNESKPTPIIINIHGGGWKSGSKDTQGGFSPFFKAGFAVANMEYRMSGQAKAPAAIEDTRCMLVYLIENAKKTEY